MNFKYQWRTATEIISGGYEGEETGVIGGTPDWVETDSPTGQTTAQYYFRDSDYGDNARSSRVIVTINESWTASIDYKNNLIVTLQTTIQSIARDNVIGNPGTVGRSMFARREAGGPLLWSVSNDPINTAHTILGTPIVLGTYTFTLAPGEDLSRGSIYFRSNTQGHDSDVPPSIYVDLMWLGTEFKNVLPRNYRPGATLKSNQKYGNVTDGIWMCHNRTDKAAHVLKNVSNMTWQEMRTFGGDDDGQGDPPLILKADDPDSWYNQREIGKY